MDEVRALLHNVEPILVQGELGQRHPGEVSKEQGAGLDGVAEAQRLLLVVDAQFGQAFRTLVPHHSPGAGSLHDVQTRWPAGTLASHRWGPAKRKKSFSVNLGAMPTVP